MVLLYWFLVGVFSAPLPGVLSDLFALRELIACIVVRAVHLLAERAIQCPPDLLDRLFFHCHRLRVRIIVLAF